MRSLNPHPPTPPHFKTSSFIETLREVDLDKAAAAAVEDIKAEEWQLDAFERRKEQQEADNEDSEELVDGWDKGQATEAYRKHQAEVEAQVGGWMVDGVCFGGHVSGGVA
jgi:hypothetical protein